MYYNRYNKQQNEFDNGGINFSNDSCIQSYFGHDRNINNSYHIHKY